MSILFWFFIFQNRIRKEKFNIERELSDWQQPPIRNGLIASADRLMLSARSLMAPADRPIARTDAIRKTEQATRYILRHFYTQNAENTGRRAFSIMAGEKKGNYHTIKKQKQRREKRSQCRTSDFSIPKRVPVFIKQSTQNGISGTKKQYQPAERSRLGEKNGR